MLLFYGLSVGHALILGLDVGYYSWLRPLIWLAQIPLLVLFISRLLMPIRSSAKLSEARRRAITATRYGLVKSSPPTGRNAVPPRELEQRPPEVQMWGQPALRAISTSTS